MGFTKLVRGWWRWWRASALLRTAEPLVVEVRHYDAAKGSGEPTALDDLEAFVRDVYGRRAALRKLRKLNDADLELVVNVDQQDRGRPGPTCWRKVDEHDEERVRTRVHPRSPSRTHLPAIPEQDVRHRALTQRLLVHSLHLLNDLLAEPLAREVREGYLQH